jgi:hypothetical protein
MSKKSLAKLDYDSLLKKLEDNLTQIREVDLPMNELKDVVKESKYIYELAGEKLRKLESEILDITEEE